MKTGLVDENAKISYINVFPYPVGASNVFMVV